LLQAGWIRTALAGLAGEGPAPEKLASEAGGRNLEIYRSLFPYFCRREDDDEMTESLEPARDGVRIF
jgi:hypothetical protein